MNITSVTGVDWTIKVIQSGDEKHNGFVNDGAPLVEFWDGVQMVASYYVSTILECEAEKCGLNLNVDASPSWKIDASSLLKVINWLKENA